MHFMHLLLLVLVPVVLLLLLLLLLLRLMTVKQQVLLQLSRLPQQCINTSTVCYNIAAVTFETMHVATFAAISVYSEASCSCFAVLCCCGFKTSHMLTQHGCVTLHAAKFRMHLNV